MHETRNNGELVERVERTLVPIVTRVMEAADVPGLALGIVKDGALVYGAGFGVRNRDTVSRSPRSRSSTWRRSPSRSSRRP